MLDLLAALVVDEGLGNASYLVDLGDGRALVVDPPRDLRALRAAAAKRGLRIAFAADTHLHADFLTGACQLAATDDATVLASASGGRTYPHRALHDGDEVDLGGLRLRVLATPGHTDEHVAFLLLDAERPVGVFTGGSMLVGAAARTDLVDPARTEELARAQYASFQRLLTLPGDVAVWPTHGAGSFCSAPPSDRRTSTIAVERATNPLARAADEATFVRRLLSSLGSYPPYFRRLADVNRRGPALVADAIELRSLDGDDVRRRLRAGTELVDVRPVADYARAHIRGSLSIPLRPAFATWLGWLVSADRPFLLLRNPDQDPGDVLWQARKIGYDIAGELAGGIDAWTERGGATISASLVGAPELGSRPVVDIRQASEYAAGHVPGASHIELGDLPDGAAGLPNAALAVMCGHGERAAGAASLLERAGRLDVSIVVGGPGDWAAATGTALETGA